MANYMNNLMVVAQQRLASLKDEKGQGMVEYALILVLVSIAAIVLLGTIGTDVNAVFQGVSDWLQSVAIPAAP